MPVQQLQQARSVVSKPLTIDQRIKKTQDDINWEAKNIWFISWAFMAIGCIGFFSGINDTFTVRTRADFVREMKQSPYHNPNITSWTIMNSTVAVPDRIENGIYDFMRTIDVVKAAIGFLVFVMGLTGYATINRGKALGAQKNFQRVFYTLMVFLIFFVYLRKQEKSVDWIVTSLQMGSLNNSNWDHVINNMPAEPVKVEEPTKRVLAADPFTKFKKTSDQCKTQHSEEDGCNKDADCVWCKCAAVPSACWSVEDSKRLPAAVYVCDKKEEEVVKDDPPTPPPAEPTWPKMQPFHPMMFFLTFGGAFLVAMLKFIEKSYAKVEFLKGAKKLVKLPGKKPVTAAPEETQSFDYSIDEIEVEEESNSGSVSVKNDMC